MPLSKKEGMTVDELIDKLWDYDPDTPVMLAVRMGDTTGLEPIVDLSLQEAAYSDQHGMMIVVQLLDYAPVIALETP